MSDFISETKCVARRIKRLQEWREYLLAKMNNNAMSEAARLSAKSKWAALNWALKHIEKTQQIAFDDAHAIDEANPKYHAWRKEVAKAAKARKDAEVPR